ncbi:MAG: LysR family transcriptional regulator [Caulobacter sp.]|nr:LysR family transcriptional regulator [Caulobacter sp.]
MKFEFLITLDAILRQGSFAAAAEDVGLTPSAVSLQVKRLEEYLGQPLFDRSGRIAKPTPLARELAENVRGALDAVEAARHRRTGAVIGRVVLGTIRSLQSAMMPPVLRDIAERHPALSVRVIQGDSTELLNQLKAGELDGAALVRPTSGGSSRLAWHDLQRQPFVFVAPRDTGSAPATELVKTHNWLQFDTSLTSGRVAASYLHRLSPSTRPKFELESIEAVLSMVSAGLGVSVIPQVGPITETHRVRQISLGKNAPSRQISFVCRASDADNRRVMALRDAFKRSYATLPST